MRVAQAFLPLLQGLVARGDLTVEEADEITVRLRRSLDVGGSVPR